MASTNVSMSAAETEARLACQDLVSAFYNFIDGGAASRVADLFCDDGVMELPSGALRGAEIKARMDEREADTSRKSFHHVGNFQFLEFDGEEAKAQSVVAVYQLPQGSLRTVARTIDEFKKTEDGRWRFKRRSNEAVWTAS